MPPPAIEITSKKEITLRALIIFCMEGIWRDAFLKALTPIIIMVLALASSLGPLYLMGAFHIQQLDLQKNLTLQ